MKSKLISICFCMLLIGASIIPVSGYSYKNKNYKSVIRQTNLKTGNGPNWPELLFPLDGEDNDRFGDSVSLYGDYAIMGLQIDNISGIWTGSAYVFKRTDNIWIQQAKLIPEDGAWGDKFGISVSVDSQ